MRVRYYVSEANDQVFIDGGTGNDTLTVFVGNNPNFTVLNAQGQVIYQQGTGDTVITAHGVEHGVVIGQEGQVLFEWWE